MTSEMTNRHSQGERMSQRLILFVILSLTLLFVPAAGAQITSIHACEKVGVDNYPPTANDDYAAWTTSAVTIDVLANDSDVDHDPISITTVSNP